MTLEDLKFVITNPLDESQYNLLIEYVDANRSSGELSDKQDLLNYLSALFSKWGEKIDSGAPKNYEKLQQLWLMLAFESLPVLSDTDQDNLFQKKIFSAIVKGLEPDDVIQEFKNFYSSTEFISTIFNRFKEDLDQNGETLGSLPIEVEGKRLLPNIKYWLLDYSKFPSKAARRGSVERLNYLTQSPNVRQLTQGQRTMLGKLIKFYDDLIAGGVDELLPQRAQYVPASFYRNNPAYNNPELNPNSNIDKKLSDLKQRVKK